MMTPVNPATSVPSRSKNAPICGPGGLALTSATEPGSRKSREAVMIPPIALVDVPSAAAVAAAATLNDAGTAVGGGSPASASTSSNPASRQRANSASSVTDARS